MRKHIALIGRVALIAVACLVTLAGLTGCAGGAPKEEIEATLARWSDLEGDVEFTSLSYELTASDDETGEYEYAGTFACKNDCATAEGSFTMTMEKVDESWEPSDVVLNPYAITYTAGFADEKALDYVKSHFYLIGSDIGFTFDDMYPEKNLKIEKVDFSESSQTQLVTFEIESAKSGYDPCSTTVILRNDGSGWEYEGYKDAKGFTPAFLGTWVGTLDSTSGTDTAYTNDLTCNYGAGQDLVLDISTIKYTDAGYMVSGIVSYPRHAHLSPNSVDESADTVEGDAYVDKQSFSVLLEDYNGLSDTSIKFTVGSYDPENRVSCDLAFYVTKDGGSCTVTSEVSTGGFMPRKATWTDTYTLAFQGE
jgi:hypothetical protein